MNFNAMVSAVQLEINDYSSRSKTRIEKWVNECHKSICQARRWSFLVIEKSDEMTFDGSNFPLDIETGIKLNNTAVAAQNIKSVYDVTDGSYKKLEHVTHGQLRDMFPSDIGGSPEYWYYLDNKTIQVYPEVDQNRKFIFSFQKKPIVYSSGATTALLIPDEYIDVLQEFVLYKAYRYKTDDRANACLENYVSLRDAMISSESNKTGIINDMPASSSLRLPKLVDAS